MKTVAVITATIGRPELEQTIDSVARQTYPCQHYVFVDGVDLGMSVPENVKLVQLPVKTGGKGIMNGMILAAGPYLVQEDMICWLDDDNWMESNHVEELVKVKGDKPYSWSLRQLRNPDGSFYSDDNFESLGHWSNFIDANCYLLDRDVAMQTAPVWRFTTGTLNIGDRVLWDTIVNNKIEGNCSGVYSLNYRLNPKRDLRAFFFEGNIKMKAHFPDHFPWAKDTQ